MSEEQEALMALYKVTNVLLPYVDDALDRAAMWERIFNGLAGCARASGLPREKVASILRGAAEALTS